VAHAPVPFAEEFRRAARTSAFWIAAARELVPVAGVIALGWSAFAAALFFLAESWLLMSLRAAAEIVLNPRYAGKDLPKSTRDAVVQVLKHFAYVLPFMGLLLGFFAAFILTVAFTRADVARFFGLEWREPAVLGGFVLMVASLGADTVRFSRTLAKGSGEPSDRDDLATKLAFYRVVALVPAAFLIGFAQALALGPAVLVLAIAVVSIAIEGAPAAIVAWIETGKAAATGKGDKPPD
jgi:hypothetical protein